MSKLGNCTIVGNAARRDYTITGLKPQMRDAITNICNNIPPNLNAQITSGYRTYDDQKRVYDYYVSKGQRWRVATPGNSKHESGFAVDIGDGQPGVQAWTHANGGSYGVHFPVPKEPWHAEHMDARRIKNIPIPPERPEFLGLAPSEITQRIPRLPLSDTAREVLLGPLGGSKKQFAPQDRQPAPLPTDYFDKRRSSDSSPASQPEQEIPYTPLDDDEVPVWLYGVR